MPRTRAALTLSDWEKLALGVDEETTDELPQVQLTHEKLQELLAEYRRLAVEQSELDARKRLVTSRMNEILEEGRRAASTLKVNLRQHFGNRNPELLRFGIQPRRRKSARNKPELPSQAEES